MAEKKKEPVGHTEKGKPIWARNEQGKPICGRDTTCYPCVSCGWRGPKDGKGPCPKCGGKCARQESICKQAVGLLPNGRCSKHGSSPGAPIIHGRRSKLYLALGIHDAAERIRTDPEILSHRENIVLTGALMEAEAEGAVSSIDVWKEAKELHAAALTGDVSALGKLGAILQTGLVEAERRKRIVDLAEKQRKHIESENRREMMAEQTMSQRQLDNILMPLLTTIIKLIPDAPVRREIAEEFSRVMLSEDRRPVALN